MRSFEKSSRLENVFYDIRGPAVKEAGRIESEGSPVIKLNIGNPAVFGFNAPEELFRELAANLGNAQGYGDARGLVAAREAVLRDFSSKGVTSVTLEDIYIGNGVSELVMFAMQALLNPGDEVLIPMPDYPLWTAAVTLSDGKAVHYLCDESSGWNPDLDDIRSKLTKKTKAIVVISPNNPTGAVYSVETLKGIAAIAKEHDLIVYADEIYSRITYEDFKHIPMASIDPEILTISFDGLSKAWLAAGFRTAWMVFSGNKKIARDYFEGIEILANLRLCSNMPSQYCVKAALESCSGSNDSISRLILPGGRLREQRDTVVNMVNKISGLSTVVPKGALYCFPKIDVRRFNITDDEKFVMDLLKEQHLLLVQGTGFNWKDPDHFRIVFLPDRETLKDAMERLGKFLETYRQK